jgi:hypothetical protein
VLSLRLTTRTSSTAKLLKSRWQGKGRTGPSKRPPQPVNNVALQHATEWLLERLLEPPAVWIGSRAQLLRGLRLLPLLSNVRCAPADSRQQERLHQAFGIPLPGAPGKSKRARLQDLHRPGTSRCRRGAALCAERCCPAATGRARALPHVPLRGAGPGVELEAQLLGRHRGLARPCCAVAYGADKMCT